MEEGALQVATPFRQSWEETCLAQGFPNFSLSVWNFGLVHVHFVWKTKVGFPDYSAYSLPLIVVSVAEIERRRRGGGTHKLDLGVGEDVDNGSGSDESLVPLKAAGKLDNRRERVMEHLFIFFRTELGLLT